MVIFSTNTDRKVKQTDSLSRSTLPMRFKQGELKVSRHMYFEWSTRFVLK